MTSLESTTNSHPHLSDNGRREIEELARYYLPTGTPFYADEHSSSRQPKHPTQDITLKALNQLGLYRLGCSHAVTCLELGDKRHIIAESSSSASPCRRGRQSRDSGIDFGEDLGAGLSAVNTRLPADQDLHSVAQNSNISVNGACLIIHQSGHNNSLRSHPIASQWPLTQFYAEFPLCSPSGFTTGFYCIMDEKQRTQFQDEDIEALQEVADSIASHLERVLTGKKYHKTLQMMNGLSALSHGPSDIHDASREERKPDGGYQNAEHLKDTVHLALPWNEKAFDIRELDRISISATGETSARTMGQQLSGSTRESSSLPEQEFLDTKMSLPSPLSIDIPGDRFHQDTFIRSSSRRGSTLISVSEVSTVSQQISTLFARASSIIRDCLDIDGALFLDASRINARSVSTSDAEVSKDGTEWISNESSSCPRRPISSFESIGLGGSERLCEILGLDLHESSASKTNTSTLAFTEDLLYDMVTTFSHGEAFNFGDGNCGNRTPSQRMQSECESLETSDRRRIVSHLTSHFTGARSILFLPLWDWNKPGWLAVCLLWSGNRGRLTSKELNYMKLFGNTIISNLARNDSKAKEDAKSDLISSISHELRSPLHGVLASTELLQSSCLQPAQQEMVEMVETCGTTLLDTMNHLLDFAKINNLRVHEKHKPSQQTVIPDLTTTFGLDILVEDVTNCLCAGYRFPRFIQQDTDQSHLNCGGKKKSHSHHAETNTQVKPSVVICVEDQDTWNLSSVSGAWKSIVMNVIGNALKFTKAGFVEITLSKSEITTSSEVVLAHLSVTDTGCGISPEFLKDRIFAPFSQEDVLTEGVGLGLSIVHQLVTSLGGHVEVNSEAGHGTQVNLFIPIERPGRDQSPFLPESQPRRVCLVGFNRHLGPKEASSSLCPETKRRNAIKRSLCSTILTQPGWTVSLADSLNMGSGDVAVIEEDKLQQLTMEGSLCTGFEHLIVLGRYGTPLASQEAFGDTKIIRLPQPIGPRQILKTLKKTYTPVKKSTDLPATPNLSALVRQQSIAKHVSDVVASYEKPALPRKASGKCDARRLSENRMDHKGLHVLIVDDNDINLKILETFMHKIRSSYDTASNGLIALETYKQSSRRFDYILMDISMPVMDGITASSKIRDYEQQKALPPSTIMAVTGVASTTMQQRAFDAGVNDYLVKPISLHYLKRIMDIR